jgi:hypothetical protein
MYARARQAGLKVDRIGTYWGWFMDRNGHYDPGSSYLKNLDSQISADLAYLPNGMSVNDCGFQILRSDNVTPRPMFNWLIQRNICLGSGGKVFTADWTCQ